MACGREMSCNGCSLIAAVSKTFGGLLVVLRLGQLLHLLGCPFFEFSAVDPVAETEAWGLFVERCLQTLLACLVALMDGTRLDVWP